MSLQQQQGGHLSPAVMRLGANRKLAAQVGGFRSAPIAGAPLAGTTQSSGLQNDELQILRRYLAGLGRK